MPEREDLSALEPREPAAAPALPPVPAGGGLLGRLAALGGVRLKLAVRFTLIMTFALALLVYAAGAIFTLSLTARARAECRSLVLAAVGASREHVPLLESDPLARSKLAVMTRALRADIESGDIPGLVELSVIRRLPGESDRFIFAASTDPGRFDAAGAGLPVGERLHRRLVAGARGEAVREEDLGGGAGLPADALEFRQNIIVEGHWVGAVRVVFDQEAISAPARRMQWTLALGGAAILLAAAVFIFLSASSFSRPLVAAARGAAAVGRGDLEVQLAVESRDEIGRLSEAFNRMVVGLREKLAMQKFVSPSTVMMIRDQAAQGEIQLGVERRQRAFLFSDIRGFTRLVESESPERVVRLLNDCLDRQTRLIRAGGGEEDKFIGDEVMAAFDDPDKELKACRAALAINAELASGPAAPGDPVLPVGIGITAGPAVVGNIGCRDRMDCTAVGDCVNLAAHLCQAAGPGEILVSESVYRACRRRLEFQPRRDVRLKGKQEEVTAYRLVGEKSGRKK